MRNMKDYPIFKHLIQFSNMVDADGNFKENYEYEERKNHLDRGSDDDHHEGGQKDKNGAYDDNDTSKNQGGVPHSSSQSMAGGLKGNFDPNLQVNQGSELSM